MATTSLLLRNVRSWSWNLADIVSTDADLLRRFVQHRDSSAFSTLLSRYGPLVLSVCRRTLRGVSETEDAFQATFLVLIRKAATLQQPDRLGAWLYGVALRTSRKLRSRSRARLAIDTHVEPAAPEDSDLDSLQTLVDLGIRRLPAKYREAVILCYLQGLTHREAADRLGCPMGTLAVRLARARERLRRWFSRRGLAVTGASLLSALDSPAVSFNLMQKTVGLTGSLNVPNRIVQLCQGVMRSMFIEKWRWVLSMAAVAALIVGGGSLAVFGGGEDDKLPPTPPQPAERLIPPVSAPIIEESSPRKPEQLLSSQSKNFRVVAPTAPMARLIAKAADDHRTRIAKLWLGKELPDWREPCNVEVAIALTGASGATTMTFSSPGRQDSDGESVSDGSYLRAARFQMTLRGSIEQILANCLPHEVTHTVMASYFGKPLPRWADEGIAVGSEDDDQLARHHQMTREILKSGRGMKLSELFALNEFPKDVTVLYAYGFSVTNFLVEKAGRKTFLEFIDQGMKSSWNKAVKQHYNFADVDELELAWRESLKLPEKPPSAKDQGSPWNVNEPGGAGPAMVFAGYDAKSKLFRIRHAVIYYEPITSYQSKLNGAVVPVTTYRSRTASKWTGYDLDRIEVTDLQGKRVSNAELMKLDKPTTMLLGVDGEKVDPSYLTIIKPGTLILTIKSGATQELIPPAIGTPVDESGVLPSKPGRE